ncbi:MAG: NB-ARC domain-containing protein, partial [Candidatus Cybelea sp.]
MPLQVTPLLGREGDLAEVEGLLDLHRLLTISGSGGIGKTRIALRVGFDLLDRFPNGAWFCDLSTISNPHDVSRAVAKVLAVRERPDHALSDSIVSWLKRKHALLIFDNCEHVVGAAAELSDEILHSCQNVRILATSRQSIGVIGEVIYRLRSLAFPEDTEALNAAAAMRYSAIALFVDRARAREHRFALTNDNAVIVGKICRRLDGIPLAIELAAARMSVLSVGTLAEKLANHFRVLSAGGKTGVPRQQTMRALNDWSYEQLSDAEQALLRRLAIFVGGFTLELADAAHASETIAEPSVFDLLASLIDKSLIQTEFGGSAARYRLLEPTRQYAREKLDESGEYAAVASVHAMAMLALAENLDADWESTPDRIVFARAEPEFENWRAALDWALRQRGDLRVGQRLAGLLDEMCLRFADVEGWHWVRAASETVDAMTPSAVLARLELAEAMLCAPLGRYKTSMVAAERAMALYDRLDDARGLTRAQHYT